MDIKKYPKYSSARLRNYSQVRSLGRLSDPNSEFSSELISGGDILRIKKNSPNQEQL